MAIAQKLPITFVCFLCLSNSIYLEIGKGKNKDEVTMAVEEQIVTSAITQIIPLLTRHP